MRKLKSEDYIGKQFGELTVINKDEEVSAAHKKLFVRVRCSCGKEKTLRWTELTRTDGKQIRDCGHRRDLFPRDGKSYNLIGQRFGRLVVESLLHTDKKLGKIYSCVCDCGNRCTAYTSLLVRGKTKSCGCLFDETRFTNCEGMTFGKLTCIKKVERPTSTSSYNGCSWWLCSCECGKTKVFPSELLLSGDAYSCGCSRRRSKGESLISSYLDRKKIDYQQEATFDGCCSVNKLRYDFYLPTLNTCIEFDGAQHFVETDFFGGKNTLADIQNRDRIKDVYCASNGIKLIRIKYTQLNNIENI